MSLWLDWHFLFLKLIQYWFQKQKRYWQIHQIEKLKQKLYYIYIWMNEKKETKLKNSLKMRLNPLVPSLPPHRLSSLSSQLWRLLSHLWSDCNISHLLTQLRNTNPQKHHNTPAIQRFSNLSVHIHKHTYMHKCTEQNGYQQRQKTVHFVTVARDIISFKCRVNMKIRWTQFPVFIANVQKSSSCSSSMILASQSHKSM